MGQRPSGATQRQRLTWTSTSCTKLREGFDLDIPHDDTAHRDLPERPGFDSLTAFELLLATDALAGTTTPPAHPPPLHTIADAFDYYNQLRDTE